MQEESVKFLPLSIGKLIYYLKHGYYHSKKVQVQQDTISIFSLFVCKEKIIIKRYKQVNESNNKVSYIMRIWKTTSFLNYFYTDFPYITNNEFIALIEYSFEDNSVRIDNIVINDSDYAALMRNTEYLNHYISHQLKIALLSYVIDIAVKNNKNKIIIKTHRNMREYNSFYSDCGFKLTRKLLDKNWFEIEYYL